MINSVPDKFSSIQLQLNKIKELDVVKGNKELTERINSFSVSVFFAGMDFNGKILTPTQVTHFKAIDEGLKIIEQKSTSQLEDLKKSVAIKSTLQLIEASLNKIKEVERKILTPEKNNLNEGDFSITTLKDIPNIKLLGEGQESKVYSFKDVDFNKNPSVRKFVEGLRSKYYQHEGLSAKAEGKKSLNDMIIVIPKDSKVFSKEKEDIRQTMNYIEDLVSIRRDLNDMIKKLPPAHPFISLLNNERNKLKNLNRIVFDPTESFTISSIKTEGSFLDKTQGKVFLKDLLGVFTDVSNGMSALLEMKEYSKSLLTVLNRISDPKLTMNVARIKQKLEKVRDKQVLHRDLACRNILVSGDKGYVADFGRSKVLSTEGVYKDPTNEAPLRWLAPECIGIERAYTAKSEAWSFGISLIEGSLATLNNWGITVPNLVEIQGDRMKYCLDICTLPDVELNSVLNKIYFNELIFSPEAINLFKNLLVRDPTNRIEFAKTHSLMSKFRSGELPFFSKSINVLNKMKQQNSPLSIRAVNTFALVNSVRNHILKLSQHFDKYELSTEKFDYEIEVLSKNLNKLDRFFDQGRMDDAFMQQLEIVTSAFIKLEELIKKLETENRLQPTNDLNFATQYAKRLNKAFEVAFATATATPNATVENARQAENLLISPQNTERKVFVQQPTPINESNYGKVPINKGRRRNPNIFQKIPDALRKENNP